MCADLTARPWSRAADTTKRENVKPEIFSLTDYPVEVLGE